MKNPFKIIEVSLPQYTIASKPDYISLGKIVDQQIEANFPDGQYLERVLSKDDHPNLSLEELVTAICKNGTDRYDPTRKSVCHEQFEIYDYDLHLGSFEIRNGKIQATPEDEQPTLFGEAIYNFYEHTPLDRGYRLRLDLMLLYDPVFFEQAKLFSEYTNQPEHRFAKYLYRFTDQKQKADALRGIVRILR
ncbi:MAG: hypothetical protein WCJ58_07815 [bacterium]